MKNIYEQVIHGPQASRDSAEMEEKHTPGPWMREDIASTRWIIGANGETIMHLGDECLPDDGLSEANARLIAAAPDMLEALESVTAEIGYENMSSNLGEKVCAIIAKARGQS